MTMTLNKLIDRLIAIRDDGDQYHRPTVSLGDLPVVFRSRRHVSDKRHRSGKRFQDSVHLVEFGCSGRLGVNGTDYISLQGDVLKDWN